MRNKVMGVIGILWGGAMTARWLMGGVPKANGAYGAGVIVGQTMGVMMLVAGLYYLFAPSDSPAPVKKKKKRPVIED